MRLLILAILVTFAFSGCGTSKKANPDNTAKEFVPDYITPGPPALVYKTKADYSKLIPVILTDDKTRIVAYPHPLDIKKGDKFSVPLQLNGGYLLDNRGITKNVAFLNMTYEEFSHLERTPTAGELYNMIIDKDPLVELIDCGNRETNPDLVNLINKLIDSGRLREVCRIVK